MLHVRPADELDSEVIFDWRNDEGTRRMSHSMQQVDWHEHSLWFDNSLRNKNRYLLICCTGDGVEKVAVVRFDINDATALISINLAPSMRGKGLAKQCLLESIAYLQTRVPTVSVIEAQIKSTNVASQKTFVGVGFVFDDEHDDVLNYTLQLHGA